MIVFFDFVIIIVIINIIAITPLVIIIQPTIKLKTGAAASVEFISNSYSKLLPKLQNILYLSIFLLIFSFVFFILHKQEKISWSIILTVHKLFLMYKYM